MDRAILVASPSCCICPSMSCSKEGVRDQTRPKAAPTAATSSKIHELHLPGQSSKPENTEKFIADAVGSGVPTLQMEGCLRLSIEI